MRTLQTQPARKYENRQPWKVNARAFSLVEVLLAIFILGVGVISIAALFPAGIAQQRMSNDDIMGPTVANNALEVLRSKLSPDDFGVWPNAPTPNGVPGVVGDTLWMRPAFTFGSQPSESYISIFTPGDTSTEINFWNGIKHQAVPDIRFSQGERYYPQVPVKNPWAPGLGFADGANTKPQYAWDCMFRRFQGKIMVAIFVYRVNIPGGGSLTYRVAPGPPPNAGLPPLPYNFVLNGTPSTPGGPGGPGNPGHGGVPWGAGMGSMANPILGTTQTAVYNPDRPDEAWQEPRQWILDQNNNIHRVTANYRDTENPPSELKVELSRPVPQMAPVINNVNQIPAYVSPNAVNRIWYLPLRDTNGVSITPVYLTVKEL